MSLYTLGAIAALYFASGVTFAIEKEFCWAGICVCWGVGNLLLILVSRG
jgi:hypothetical protein